MLNVAVALGAHQAEAVVEAEAVAEVGGLVADHHLEVAAHIPMADMDLIQRQILLFCWGQ